MCLGFAGGAPAPPCTPPWRRPRPRTATYRGSLAGSTSRSPSRPPSPVKSIFTWGASAAARGAARRGGQQRVGGEDGRTRACARRLRPATCATCATRATCARVRHPHLAPGEVQLVDDPRELVGVQLLEGVQAQAAEAPVHPLEALPPHRGALPPLPLPNRLARELVHEAPVLETRGEHARLLPPRRRGRIAPARVAPGQAEARQAGAEEGPRRRRRHRDARAPARSRRENDDRAPKQAERKR